MSDRITGFIFAILALAFAAGASQLELPFFADPLGPKAFPFMISAIGFIASASLVFKPDEEPSWPGLATMARLVIATAILVVYAYSLKPLGFVLPTAIASALLSYQIRPRAMQNAFIGIILAVGLFIIFKHGFGLGLYALPRWVLG